MGDELRLSEIKVSGAHRELAPWSWVVQQVLFLLAASEMVPLLAAPPRGSPELLSATQQWLAVRRLTLFLSSPIIPLGGTPRHRTASDQVSGSPSSGPV